MGAGKSKGMISPEQGGAIAIAPIKERIVRAHGLRAVADALEISTPLVG